MKKIVVALLLAAALTVGARAYYTSRGGTGAAVSEAPITTGDILATVSATGTLQGVTTLQVGTQVSGSIAWLGADFNSLVRKGQVIARLDPSLLQAQVEQARANLTQVNASIDESDIGRVTQDQPVTFTVDAYPGESFTGRVAQVRLQPAVVQNVTTYSVIIVDAPNTELKLKPGMTASLTFEIARRDDVLRVPNAALRFRPTASMFAAIDQTPAPSPRGSHVWQLADGLLVPVPVEIGLSDGSQTELMNSHLTEGAVVVTSVTIDGAETRSTTTAGPGTSCPEP